MRRIEYWLLGAVAALVAFVAFESVKGAQPPTRYAFQIEQAGRPRPSGAAADSNATQDERNSSVVDVNSIVLPSRAPAPVRNVAEIRKRITDGAQRTYIVDMLSLQDSTLFRWPDSRHVLRVWIESDPHIPDWWIGYVQSARDVFLEWEGAGIPLKFQFAADSLGSDIVVTWTDRFPSNEDRIGKTHRLHDQNSWVTHAEILVSLHDPDGDRFPVGEISQILRHEIGHALGLGHSRNKSTIMYPQNTQLEITELDRETLHLLYELPPGRVK